jgi:phage shock protein PspC (stress-responsive transcriptional regulator)
MPTATTATPADNSLAGARAWFAQNHLTRPKDGRMFAGVSAGFARRYRVNPLVARIAALTAVVVLTPLVYVALWVLMPGDAPDPEIGVLS